MKKKDHLPVFGIGPVCVYLMAGLAAAGIALHCCGILDSGRVPSLRLPFAVLGTVLIAAGIYLWVRAVFGAKIAQEIRQNHLVVTGVYAWVRNPVYSAVAVALTGLCLWFANLWLLLLPVLFREIITLMMRCTEEKWLLARYGDEYRDYCAKVNRCIPMPPRKK